MNLSKKDIEEKIKNQIALVFICLPNETVSLLMAGVVSLYLCV